MNNTTSPCSDVCLHVLLDTSEGSAEFNVAAEHLESCEHCQTQLADLAAGRNEWHKARRSKLMNESDALFERERFDRSWTVGCHEPPPKTWDDAMSRQLLLPPSHPEMLGRLERYEIEPLIGSGGMGVVFKGFDSELNRPVAIKVLAPHLTGSGADNAQIVAQEILADDLVTVTGARQNVVWVLFSIRDQGGPTDVSNPNLVPGASTALMRVADQNGLGFTVIGTWNLTGEATVNDAQDVIITAGQ
ncbi:MAG: hypothetical protein ABGZ53_05000 [Fuerstiella sp.]